MSADNLTQSAPEVAPQVDSGSVDSNVNPEVGIDNIAAELASDLMQDLSDEDRGGLQLEPQESEESEEVEETPPSDSTDDETPDIEADDDVEDDDEPTEVLEGAWDVEYDEVKDARLPIKINGEVKMMAFGEIQNQLARAEAASTKSREVNQQLEEAEALRSQLEEEKAFVGRQKEAAKMSDEVAVRVNYIRQMEAQLKKAVESKNSHDATLLRERITAVTAETNEIYQRVTEAEAEAQQKHLAEQHNLLVSKGYGDVVNDGYVQYVQGNLSEAALKAVNEDASLAIALEKARKWDESQSKGKTRKLTKKTKTLSAGKGNVKSTQSADEKAKASRFANRTASKEEAEDALLSFAQNFINS